LTDRNAKGKSAAVGRRAFLRLAASGIAGAAISGPLSACGGGSPSRGQTAPAARGDGRVLLAYFSRPGENYWNGGRRNLRVGNTEVLAELIAERLPCDVHRIEPADPYPEDYDATRAQRARAGRRCPPGHRQPARLH
jgi:hypothetical protein